MKSNDLPDAKLLRKKLKNGLIIDKWDLVTIIEKQQAELKELKLARLADLDVILKQRAEIELLFKEIPEWEQIVNRNCNKPNPHVGNLDKEEYVYKMGDIEWTKALK